MRIVELGRRATRVAMRAVVVAREKLDDNVARWRSEGLGSRHVAAAAAVGVVGIAADLALGGVAAPLVALGSQAATLAIATSAATSIARRRGLVPRRVLASAIDHAESARLTSPHVAHAWRLACGLESRSAGLAACAFLLETAKGMAVALVARGASKRVLKVVPWIGPALRLCYAGRSAAEGAMLVAFIERHAEELPRPHFVVIIWRPELAFDAEPALLVA